MTEEQKTPMEIIAEALDRSGLESPASITGKLYDPNGVDILVTLRNGNMKQLAENWQTLSDILINQRGYTPQGGGRSLPMDDAPPILQPDPAELEAELNPKASRKRAPVGRSFEAETMVGSMHEGEDRWKIKGGRYKRWGVTIYEEVIKQAFRDGVFWDIEEGALDVRQTYDMTGVRAYYEINEQENPTKVTRLERLS